MSDPLKVATDGGCWPNPGPGGWAWVAQDGRYEAGSFGAGTNNVAELLAIKHALLAFPDEPVEIIYDSQYAANSVTVWGPGWRRKGVTEKANIDLIFSIMDVYEARPTHAPVTWTHVRGHRGHDLNEQANALASKMVQMPDGHHERGDGGPDLPGPVRCSRQDGGRAAPRPDRRRHRACARAHRAQRAHARRDGVPPGLRAPGEPVPHHRGRHQEDGCPAGQADP